MKGPELCNVQIAPANINIVPGTQEPSHADLAGKHMIYRTVDPAGNLFPLHDLDLPGQIYS